MLSHYHSNSYSRSGGNSNARLRSRSRSRSGSRAGSYSHSRSRSRSASRLGANSGTIKSIRDPFPCLHHLCPSWTEFVENCDEITADSHDLVFLKSVIESEEKLQVKHEETQLEKERTKITLSIVDDMDCNHIPSLLNRLQEKYCSRVRQKQRRNRNRNRKRRTNIKRC